MNHIELSGQIARASWGKIMQSPWALPENAKQLEEAAEQFDEAPYSSVNCWTIMVVDSADWRPIASVVADYDTALRTALCLDVVYRMERTWRGRFTQHVKLVCTPVALDLNKLINGMSTPLKEHDYMTFTEFLASERAADNVYDYTQNDGDLDEHISGMLYGPQHSPIIIVLNEHTDDLFVQYGDLTFTDNDDDEAKAVAYKVYLFNNNVIDEKELQSYFDGFMRKRNSITY